MVSIPTLKPHIFSTLLRHHKPSHIPHPRFSTNTQLAPPPPEPPPPPPPQSLESKLADTIERIRKLIKKKESTSVFDTKAPKLYSVFSSEPESLHSMFIDNSKYEKEKEEEEEGFVVLCQKERSDSYLGFKRMEEVTPDLKFLVGFLCNGGYLKRSRMFMPLDELSLRHFLSVYSRGWVRAAAQRFGDANPDTVKMTSCQEHQLLWKIFSNQFSGLNALDSLPCLLFLICLRDTFMPEDRNLRDPRRLYAPGRMYHIVERKFCRCGRFPPEVRTAIPVDGRFEHIVLSCNATSDHAILWIEREAQKALERMRDGIEETVTTAPGMQRFERRLSLEKEHKDALERAVSLNVPHAVSSEVEFFPATDTGEEPSVPREGKEKEEEQETNEVEPAKNGDNATYGKSKSDGGSTNWDLVVQKLFNKNASGKLQLRGNLDTPN